MVSGGTVNLRKYSESDRLIAYSLLLALVAGPLLVGCGEPDEVDAVHILVPRDLNETDVNDDRFYEPDRRQNPSDALETDDWVVHELEPETEQHEIEPAPSTAGLFAGAPSDDNEDDASIDGDEVVEVDEPDVPDDIVVNHEPPLLDGVGAYTNTENNAVGIAVLGRDTDVLAISYVLVSPLGEETEPAEMMISEAEESLVAMDSVRFDSEGGFSGSVAFILPASEDVASVVAIRVTVIDHTQLRSNTIEQPIVNPPRLGRGARCDELAVLNQCHVEGDRCQQMTEGSEPTCQP